MTGKIFLSLHEISLSFPEEILGVLFGVGGGDGVRIVCFIFCWGDGGGG